MSEWIDFEIWIGEVGVQGYMNINDCKLQWYNADGFECYDDFEQTEPHPIGNTFDVNVRYGMWKLIDEFVGEYNLPAQLKLIDDGKAVLKYCKTVDDCDFIVTLYVNCSRVQQGYMSEKIIGLDAYDKE